MLHILHTNPHTHNQKNTKFNVLCLCLIHQCENSKQYHADCQPPNKKTQNNMKITVSIFCHFIINGFDI